MKKNREFNEDKIIKSGKKTIKLNLKEGAPHGLIEIFNDKNEKILECEKKENHKITNISLEGKNKKLKIENKEENKNLLTMEKKDQTGKIQKILEVGDFSNKLMNGVVYVKNIKNKNNTKINMKNNLMNGLVEQETGKGDKTEITFNEGVKNGPIKIYKNNQEKEVIIGNYKNGILDKKLIKKNKNTSQSFKVDGEGKVKKPKIQIAKLPFLFIQTLFNKLKRTIGGFFFFFIKTFHKIKNFLLSLKNKCKNFLKQL